MNSIVEKICIWFLGAFVGSGMFVWHGWHWAAGLITGAGLGIGLTLWRELLAYGMVFLGFVGDKLLRLVTFHRRAYWTYRRVRYIWTREELRRIMLQEFIIFIMIVQWVGFLSALLIFSHPKIHSPTDMLAFLAAVSLFVIVGGLLTNVHGFLTSVSFLRKQDEVTPCEMKTMWSVLLSFNLVTAGFTILILTIVALGFFLRFVVVLLTDHVEWKRLVIAFHTKPVLVSATVCLMGTVAGIFYGNPWLGGTVATFCGLAEQIAFKYLILPRLVAQNIR